MRPNRFRTLSVVTVLWLAASVASAQTKLLRFPAVHGDRVAFCYAGDIWTAPVAGGTATRITAHPGLELFPHFSPDGKWIAFTGQYDGDEQVYVVPAEGGVPRQLTFYPARGPLNPRWGYDNQVYGWTVDGKAVLFRSLRDHWDLGDTQLYTVSVDGGLPVALPMPNSGAGTFSPDGAKVCYSPLARDFRTWKRYQGGWAEDLFIFDLATHASENITNNPRTDRDPMWIGNAIYFASDRDGTLNLYRYDIATRATSELTHSTTFDVRWPSSDAEGRIVYEFGGELRVFDTRNGADTPTKILVPDDGVAMRPSHYPVEKFVEDFALAPKGERALFVARGDVFTVPIEHGVPRNLTDSSNAHDKWARWSPDGKRVAFVSDRSGEEEVYLVNQDGSGGLEALTTDLKAMLYAPVWSPDGEYLAFSDKDGRLYALRVADRKRVEVAQDRHGSVLDYQFSPRGHFLAFSLANPSNFRSIHVWSAADGTTRELTDPNFNSFEPVWDPAGNYLFFLSDREYAPQISRAEFDFATTRQTGIFALALRRDVANPFPFQSDEVKPPEAAATPKPGEKETKPTPKPTEPLAIDFDGLAARVARVPVTADNLADLAANEGGLLYLRRPPFVYGREPESKGALVAFSFDDRKETVLAEDTDAYAVSADGKKLLVHQDKAYNLLDASPKSKEAKKAVAVKDLAVDRIPAQEWAEIFNEVWRRYRDFFYVPNMHGYDWEGLGARYRALLPYVAHRSDLNYVLGEMVAELNIGHAYIQGGDFDIPERPKVALPGARFALDPKAGRYRIAEIFAGENEEERYRSPLTEIGVDARVGDYVLAIDGEELKANDSPYRLLRFKADRPVRLTLNAVPDPKGAREVTYRPITTEADLIYLDWVKRCRDRVSQATGGRVGYIHLPDMAEDGIREFVKWYYPQIRKQALIVDDRSNGGGNVSQMVIERLSRTLLGTGFGRTSRDTETYPDTVFVGPMVCLLNETSASDGDIFPYMFRKAGLGPLIGKRSWGGVVGIGDHGPLLDGGDVFVPEDATASDKGEWVIEGHGVDPDIVVENDPAAVIAGRDPQLERAIVEVTKALEAHPRPLPPRPPAPVKTR
ncbi:MAG TPA: S41 family peptidase [Thermoanaerobaculaceae bacterium]|nr:S41 family peptidase [Thermoanaerobaculaceae bacterium]